MALNLFIDTNIFLAFYHLTGDDLEELKKLSVLIENGEIVLLLPRHVEDEFLRNREAKIAEAIRKIREQHLNLQFPQICKDYPEYEAMRVSQKEYEEAHAELLKKIDEDITSRKLKADEVIEKLFVLATKIPITEMLISKALLRTQLGNPPGKRGSLGDALNWEALLEATDPGEPLHFVTDDNDF